MATAFASPRAYESAATPRPALRLVRRSEVKGEELWKRWEALKGQRSLWEFDWQDVVNLLVPGADDVIDWRAPGESRTEYIYDSRPLMAPQTLAANMQGAVTNPALQWFRLRFRLQALNELQHVNGWLQACDTTMLAAYNGSNFYQAAHTFYVHLGAFGTAAMYIQARRGVLGTQLQFRSLPVGSYCIAENAEGRVDTLFRECWFSPRQAYQQFGEGITVRAMTALSNAQQMDKPEKYLHAVYPREERRPDRLGNRDMPWVSCYLDAETKAIVQESGFEEFPFVVSRWETLSQSPYGFGPGHMALPDIRVLNKLRELNLDQLILWAQPPLRVLREAMLGAVSLDPYGLNVMSQADALTTLDLTGRPDLVQISAAELMQSINDLFYVNALQALPPPDASKMTAFEVAQRLELMQRLMGPAFTRLLHEMLDPLADRVFGLLLRARVLPFPPMEVLEAAAQQAGQLDIEYEGPLARSQRGVDIQSLGQIIGMGAQIVQVRGNADVLDNIDWDKAYRDTAEISGGQRAWLLDMQDVLRMRQARNAQQQALMEQANTRENVKALPSVASTMESFHNMMPQAA